MKTTRQEYKEKIVNRIAFLIKIKDKAIIESMKKATLDEVMFYYINSLPEPKNTKSCNTQFALIRKYVLPLIKKKGEHSTYLREIQDRYKKFIKDSGATNISNFTPEQYDLYKLYLKTIDHYETIVKIFEDMILNFNARLETICDFYDMHDLEFNSFCSMLNMNPITARLNIHDENEDDDPKEHKHYRYIFLGVEDDRQEDGWKNNKSNNMPLHHLTSMNFILMLDRNKDLKEKVNNKIMDMGFAEHAMTLHTNPDGSKTLERFYPKLRLVD